MIDSFLLWLFVKISSRWFGSVIFATDPETTRTTSIFFFDDCKHAKQFMDIIEREKLNHKLEKKS
jgi:hypothetical protein